MNAKGIELEAVMTPVDTLTFTAGATFASTKYAENLTGFEGSSLSPVLFQLPGRTMSNATDYVVTGSVSWTPQISEKLSGLVYMDFRFNSDLNTGSDLDLEKTQPSYTVVNMRLGIYGDEPALGHRAVGDQHLQHALPAGRRRCDPARQRHLAGGRQRDQPDDRPAADGEPDLHHVSGGAADVWGDHQRTDSKRASGGQGLWPCTPFGLLLNLVMPTLFRHDEAS